MEMQFRITEGSFPMDIPVRTALEMPGLLSIPGNEGDFFTDSEMENVPWHDAEQGGFLKSFPD